MKYLKWRMSAPWVSYSNAYTHCNINNSAVGIKIELPGIQPFKSLMHPSLQLLSTKLSDVRVACSLLSELSLRDCTSLQSAGPSWNRSACWSEKECTVYWPQFCGSVVSNFTARFLSALTIMDGTAMREQGHLAAEPQSAPLSWQAWWMRADEYTLALLQPGASLCLWATRNAAQ